MSDWIYESHRAAAAKVRAELAKPIADDGQLHAEVFDPWELFPCLYGTYSQAFDIMALDVLRALALAADDKWDEALALQRKETLAHEMFREILCTSDLCDYGTSPRVCFATLEFAEVLPELIAKWEAFSLAHWGSAALGDDVG